MIKVMLPRLRALPKLEVACEQDEPYAIPAFLDSESVLPEDRLGKGITIAIAAMGPQSRPSLFHEK